MSMSYRISNETVPYEVSEGYNQHLALVVETNWAVGICVEDDRDVQVIKSVPEVDNIVMRDSSTFISDAVFDPRNGTLRSVLSRCASTTAPTEWRRNWMIFCNNKVAGGLAASLGSYAETTAGQVPYIASMMDGKPLYVDQTAFFHIEEGMPTALAATSI